MTMEAVTNFDSASSSEEMVLAFVLVWVANLSDCASLAREWKGDGMERRLMGKD